MSTNPTAACLVIGDEILSGRTQEANAAHLAKELNEVGIALDEIRVVPDVEHRIITALNALRAAHDYVFTSGGIGPTHDDITADAVAKAFGLPIDVRGDARAILQKHYDATGQPLNDARLRMARIPDTAALIHNPVSAAPGFVLENVYVLAGVPKIFKAMLEGILPELIGGAKMLSATETLQMPEGEFAAALGALDARFPTVSFGSYPFITHTGLGVSIVARSRDSEALSAAIEAVRQAAQYLDSETP